MLRSIIFPLAVAVIYGVTFIVAPARAMEALRASLFILVRVGIALSLVFFLIFALNLFLKPAHLVRLLGKGLGPKGIFISTIAGILSVGPIYTWYPLLKELKSKGMRVSLIAMFINCRAIKPVLLPVMISYFGSIYVLIFTLTMILASWICGLAVEIAMWESGSRKSVSQ